MQLANIADMVDEEIHAYFLKKENRLVDIGDGKYLEIKAETAFKKAKFLIDGDIIVYFVHSTFQAYKSEMYSSFNLRAYPRNMPPTSSDNNMPNTMSITKLAEHVDYFERQIPSIYTLAQPLLLKNDVPYINH